MDKLPRVEAKDIIRVLEKKGFVLVRQSGSHKIYRNKEGKRVTIPKVLKNIIKDAEISIDELKELL